MSGASMDTLVVIVIGAAMVAAAHLYAAVGWACPVLIVRENKD